MLLCAQSGSIHFSTKKEVDLHRVAACHAFFYLALGMMRVFNWKFRFQSPFPFVQTGGLFVFFLMSLLPAKAQVQENLDSLINNDLPFFQELSHSQNPEVSRMGADTLFSQYIPTIDQETIEDRVSCLDLDMPLVVNKTVCGFIHFFTVRKRNYTQTMLERKNYYFPIFEYYLRKHNMPDALKYLSIVESGLNYRAKSRTGALGLWQFMPGTGKDFYLAQNQHIDERQNPYLATEAACKFLKYLYGMFNDWELALAAYNCGPGNVMKAMRKSGKRGFWEIYNFLPKETRSYVPQFHAVVYSMHYASAHNIFPDVDSVLTTAPLDTFRTNKAFDICKLEQILGLPNQCLLLHNPDLKTNIFPANCAQPLLVPITHSSPLALNLDVFLDSAKVNWGRVNTSRISSSKGDGSFKWIWVPKGSHPSRLAKKHGVDVQTLCQLNHIKNSPIKKGKRLRFPTESQFAEPVVVKNQESKKEIAPVESKEALQEFLPEGFHRVKKAEKLYQLAIQYGSSTRQIREWNSLTSSRIHEGQILRVVPGPSTACIDTIPVTEGCSESTAPAHYRVKRGDRLFQIAKSHGLTMAQLLAANPEISSELKAGQLLNIPSINQKADPHADLALNLKSSKTKSKPKNAEEVFSKTYRVQKGDTLYSITRKFNRLTIKDLMRLNNLKNKNIKPGQQLIVG